MRLAKTALALISAAALTASAAAENWPHWRGPDRNGVSSDGNVPLTWSQTDNIAWKLALPDLSGSTPIIWGESIFLNVVDGDDIYLYSIERGDGAIRWRQLLASGNLSVRTRKGNMSSPSPVTDGKMVWVMTGTGVLSAFDFQGKKHWERNLVEDYGKIGVLHGYSSSPLLHEETIYVQVLHGFHTDDPSYLLAFDAKTGKTKWRVERPTDALAESPDAYTTPALYENGGSAQIVVLGGDYVTGHDAASGKELWRGGGLNPARRKMYRIVASPIVMGDMIYAPTRVRPLIAFRGGGSGDITESHKVWSTQQGPDVPTPATDGKYFYILRDRGTMLCLNAKSGEVIYDAQRIRAGTYSASPVVAAGRVYVTSEEGVTSVIQAGPEFKVLAENELSDYTLSSPAISRGQIFMRTKNYLYAIGERSSR